MPSARRNSGEAELNREFAIAASVLKRDAAKTDYIVLPLFAGLLARITLATAMDESDEPGAEDDELSSMAQAILDDSQVEHDAAWSESPDRYGRIAEFVLGAWSLLDALVPLSYSAMELGPYRKGLGEKADVAAVVEWLKANPGASTFEQLLIAARGVSSTEARRDEHPLLGNATRGIRVELASRLRAAGTTRWPEIVRLSAAEWNADNLGRFALVLAEMTDDLLYSLTDAVMPKPELDTGEHTGAEDHQPPADVTTRDSSAPTDGPAVAAIQAELRETLARKTTLEQQIATLRHERDEQADRHARADSRVDALTEETHKLRARITDLEFRLLLVTRERDDLASLIFTEEQPAPADPDVAAHTLAGRRVLLYTGQAAADAREAMRQAFFDSGAAEVDCYWTNKSLGPDRVPPDRIVVIDVTFMSHATANRVDAMARRSKAQLCYTKAGSARIAQDVAARLVARGKTALH